jgi:hypothetical protein
MGQGNSRANLATRWKDQAIQDTTQDRYEIENRVPKIGSGRRRWQDMHAFVQIQVSSRPLRFPGSSRGPTGSDAYQTK